MHLLSFVWPIKSGNVQGDRKSILFPICLCFDLIWVSVRLFRSCLHNTVEKATQNRTGQASVSSQCLRKVQGGKAGILHEIRKKPFTCYKNVERWCLVKVIMERSVDKRVIAQPKQHVLALFRPLGYDLFVGPGRVRSSVWWAAAGVCTSFQRAKSAGLGKW